MFHTFVWLFAVFGGIISNKILFFNIFILLPIFYIVQAKENHPIMKEKVKYILTNIESFEEPKPFISYCYNQLKETEVEHLQKELGYSKDKIIKAIMIIKGYEDYMIFPKIITSCYRKFCNSYRNPFDTHGLLILGYIVNSYIFLYKNYSYVVKELNY